MAKKSESGLAPEFQYDLTALLKVDPKLVQYEQTARFDTGLKEPRAIAVAADGRVLVGGDATIRTFDAAGKLVAEFKTAAAPYALAVGKAGAIYAAMKDHVEVFDAAGTRLAAWAPLGEKAYLTSIVAGESDVFAADAGSATVLRYDLAGKLLGRIGEKNEAKHAKGIILPSPYFDVALGAEGMLWVVNPGLRQVECYTYDGDFRFDWVSKSSPRIEDFCGCCNPTHLAVFADGSFVTSEKGLPRVKTFNAEGKFLAVVAPPSAFAEGTTGLDLAVDKAGRVLVLDPFERAVRVFVRKNQESK